MSADTISSTLARVLEDGVIQCIRLDNGSRALEICRAAAPAEGNFVHDCRIAAVMRENGIDRILTRDSSFRRIAFLEVVDPLA